MKLRLFFFCQLILSSSLVGQSIEGDTTICTGETIKLEVTGLNTKSNPPARYYWYKQDRPLGTQGATFKKKNAKPEDGGIYRCEIDVPTYLKNISGEDSIAYTLKEVETTVLVFKNPADYPPPSYTINESTLYLQLPRNESGLDYQWLGPDEEKYSGAVVELEDVKINQVGKYTLEITDTSTNCTTDFELDVGAENKTERPKNIFGTIDEDTGELAGVLRRADRNFPIYPADILGQRINDQYDIAQDYSVWQVLGEVDQYYLVKYIPTQQDRNTKKEFEKNYQLLIRRIDTFYYQIDTIRQALSRDYYSRFDERYENINELEDEIINTVGEITAIMEVSGSKKYYRYSEFLPVKDLEHHYVRDDLDEFESIDEQNRKLYDDFREKVFQQERKNRYFLVDRLDFEVRSRVYKYKSKFLSPGFTAGTVLIPVKLRFDEFQFSKDVTLGPFFGLRWATSHFNPNYFSLGFSTGITSVRLSPRNTETSFITEVQDVAAFTLSLGGVLEFNNVQLGLFAGWDWINNDKGGEEGINWRYQGHTWLSIGLGYSIVSRPSPSRNGKRAQANTDK